MKHIFLINPYAGRQNFADELRKKLKERNDIEYYVFSTRAAATEAETVKKICNIFEDDKIRLYCCGGTSTMRNALNGITNFRKIEVAFIPNGLGNSYSKMFAKNSNLLKNINDVIDGKIVNVDYIYTNHGITLNTLSIGYDPVLVEKYEEYRPFNLLGESVPYHIAMFFSILFSKVRQGYEIKVDDNIYLGEYEELIIGNGRYIAGDLSFSKEASVRDGILEYCFIRGKDKISLLKAGTALLKDNQETLSHYANMGRTVQFSIKRKDGKVFSVDFDGEIINGISELQGHVVKQGMKLVVPKGVLNEF